MIWEDTVEIALQQLLVSTTNMTVVLRGMQDENFQLTLPALIVWCEVSERIPARREIYKVRCVIEYKSIPEENLVSSITGVENIMQQVDIALTTQPQIAIPTAGVNGILVWQGVTRTQQEIHTDRRTNIREIDAILAFS